VLRIVAVLAPAVAPGDERGSGKAGNQAADPGRQRAQLALLATRGGLMGRSSGA
jgi:hypothetical protein